MDDGERIDRMIDAGREVVRQAMEGKSICAIVAAYSSGDDSIVSSHFAMTYYADAFVFNADTKFGLTPSRTHLVNVCEKMDWQLEVDEANAEGPPKKMRQGGHLVAFDPATQLKHGYWRDGPTAYEEFVLNHGFPGRGKPQHARMYQRLKERPFRRMLQRVGASKASGKPKAIIISGIRSDESANRAGYRRAWADGYYGDVWVNPFYHFTAADFELYRQEFGLPRNPVKRLCGISGECCCGTFGDYAERQAYRAVDPVFSDGLDALERRVKEVFPWGWGESPPRWWKDQQAKQGFIFDDQFDSPHFQPMCVGCNNGRR